MRRRTKTIISMLLGCVMLLSLPGIPVRATEYVASVGTRQYTTVSQAIANSNGQVVKLLADSQESVSVTGDLYLDLNGHNLKSLSIVDGILYGMDSTTDDYDCSDGYGRIFSFSGDHARHFKSDITGAVKRYLAVEEDGISFHRFYAGITHMSLKPSVKGVGYKAVFAGDSVFASQLDPSEAFGYTLRLGEYLPVVRWKGSMTFASEDPLALRINGYDAAAHGDTSLCANVQVKLKDGTVIQSSDYSYTLRSLVERINDRHTESTRDQLAALAGWIKADGTMSKWMVENILKPKSLVTFYDADCTTVLGTGLAAEGTAATLPQVNDYAFLGWSGRYADITENQDVYAVYSDQPNVFALSSTSGQVGDTVTLLLRLEGDTTLCSYNLVLQYDTSVLKLVEYDNERSIYMPTVNPEKDDDGFIIGDNGDCINLVWASAMNQTRNADIIELQFEIMDTEAAATFVDVMLNGVSCIENSTQIDAQYALIDGVITIE